MPARCSCRRTRTREPIELVSYAELEEGWKAFNRVYLYLYDPADQARIDDLLGQDADPDRNRERALATSQSEVEGDSGDAYAWFNLGSNLVYFERYGEAAGAFDRAMELGLPWRFTRYQFGPYLALFHQGRFEELYELADYTLFRTYKAEEFEPVAGLGPLPDGGSGRSDRGLPLSPDGQSQLPRCAVRAGIRGSFAVNSPPEVHSRQVRSYSKE